MNKKKNYTFSLILNGVNSITSDLENQIFEAGCDDAILYSKNGIVFLEFDRESNSLKSAILSAIGDVEKIEEISVSVVEPADYVLPSEIARRAGLTREYIRVLINGNRGPGNFPKPLSGSNSSKSSIYSWCKVSTWLTRVGTVKDRSLFRKAFIFKKINDALESRDDESTRNIPTYLLDPFTKKKKKSINKN